MVPELRKVGSIALATSLAGAVLGALMGAWAAQIPSLEYLAWVAGSMVVGAGLGFGLAYGLLPES